MNYRPFGHTGASVSEIGLGCWQLGGAWGEDVPEAEAVDILRASADAGVTFFDTADVYGDGRSERLIGRFLKDWGGAGSRHLFVATKLGRFATPGWPGNFTREAVRAHTDASLQRLGVDALALTQLHCVPTDVLRAGEIFEHLRELRREGKVRHFGASVESMEEARICLEQPDLASLQIIFNIFRQKPIHELFGEAQRRGVALVVRLPLASGLLAGRMNKSTHFAPSDHRNFNRDGQQFNVGETFAGLPFERGVGLAERVKAILPQGGADMSALALRWCLDFPAVSTVIPGAKNVRQARANAAAGDLPPLGWEVHERLAALYRDDVEAHIRGPY
jgi:aryl-alcohol dehydrogenase-like predicted oxidoreductase